MSTAQILLIGIGALAGLLVAVAIGVLTPAPPALNAALDRLHPPVVTTGPQRSFQDRFGKWLVHNLPSTLTISKRDLQLVGVAPENLLLRKFAFGLGGLAFPLFIPILFALVGMSPPVLVPLGMGLVLALIGFLVPDFDVRRNASTARTELRRALASYFDLVALERSRGGAVIEALRGAATVGGSWPFRRIQVALARSEAGGKSPWEALSALGEETGVTELNDLAAIMAVAGEDGGKVRGALLRKAAAIRESELAAAETDARDATARMSFPAALVAILAIIMLLIPSLANLMKV